MCFLSRRTLPRSAEQPAHGVLLRQFLGVTLDDGSPLVRGRNLTSFSTTEEDGCAREDVPFDLEDALRAEGASNAATDSWQPKLVVDARLITGQNPQSGTLVGEALVDALKQI